MQHLGLVMDGNRRWARAHGLMPSKGHEVGLKAIERVAEFCLQRHIPHLSLYSFSTENFNRPAQELAFLFALPAQYVDYYLDIFLRQDIKVRFIGDRSLFPEQTKHILERIEQETQHRKTLTIHMLFCYGGRQEIFNGVKTFLQKVQEEKRDIHSLRIQDFEQCLWMSDVPNPDLIIRTGGAQRLSNFLLYHAAYSELYFLDCFWPDISIPHLEQALTYFNQCKRNFGA